MIFVLFDSVLLCNLRIFKQMVFCIPCATRFHCLSEIFFNSWAIALLFHFHFSSKHPSLIGLYVYDYRNSQTIECTWLKGSPTKCTKKRKVYWTCSSINCKCPSVITLHELLWEPGMNIFFMNSPTCLFHCVRNVYTYSCVCNQSDRQQGEE